MLAAYKRLPEASCPRALRATYSAWPKCLPTATTGRRFLEYRLLASLAFTRSRMQGHGEGIVNETSICGILVRRGVVSPMAQRCRGQATREWEKRMKFLMLVCVEEDRFENEAAARPRRLRRRTRRTAGAFPGSMT